MKYGYLAGLACLIPFFTGCTSFQALNSIVPRGGYVLSADLPYGSRARQKLDVYCPKRHFAGADVVVFFYGGSWRSGNKADYRFAAEALTSRGFIAVLPDYRVYPEVIFPAFVEDGASAVRWVEDNIARFGGNTNRIFLMGHSAGAHIAALLTLDGHYLEAAGLDRNVIRATAGLSGPYDFIPSAADREVFGLAPDDPTQKIQPIHFVDGHEPPMLLIQGLRDKIVGPVNASRLAKRIREAGGQVEHITFPRRGHKTVALALAAPFRWLAPVLNDVTDYFHRH